MALLCVRLWNVLVSLLGLIVYLLGLRRSVYPYEEVWGSRNWMHRSRIGELILKAAILPILQIEVDLGSWTSRALELISLSPGIA